MDKLMFRNILPMIFFPNDAQCPKCGYFNTMREDVLDLLRERAIMSGREVNVNEAKCRCGPLTLVQLPYKET